MRTAAARAGPGFFWSANEEGLRFVAMNAPDPMDVARQAMNRIITDPLTWLPFALLAALYAFVGLPVWVLLGLFVAMFAVAAKFWAGRWPRLTEKVRTTLVAQYRQAENAELGGRLTRLANQLSHLPTKRLIYELREVMEIKLAVEKRLFADGKVTPHEEEINEMVAELVRTMVAEAERAPLCEGDQLPKAAAARFEKAAETLRQVFEDIEVILDPVPESMRLPEQNDALSRASERLGERLEQARGVRRHMEQGVGGLGEPPPAGEPGEPPGSERRPVAEG